MVDHISNALSSFISSFFFKGSQNPEEVRQAEEEGGGGQAPQGGGKGGEDGRRDHAPTVRSSKGTHSAFGRLWPPLAVNVPKFREAIGL